MFYLVSIQFLFYIIWNFFLLVNTSLIYSIMYYINFLFINTVGFIFFILLFCKNKYIYIYIFILILIFQFANFYTLNLFTIKWFNGLIYGFNLIHPLLFYLINLILLIKIINFLIIKLTNKNLFLLTTLTMILGMYWGSINSGWGFFWTNDNIELVLLYIIIYIGLSFHIVKLKIINWVDIYLFYLIICFLFCVRFNFVFSVHSFFTKPFVKSLIFIHYSLLTILYNNFFFYLILIFINYKLILFYLLIIKLIYSIYNVCLKFYIYIIHLLFIFIVFFFIFNTYYYILFNNFINTFSKIIKISLEDNLILTNKLFLLFSNNIYFQNFLTNLYYIKFYNIILYTFTIYYYYLYISFFYYFVGIICLFY